MGREGVIDEARILDRCEEAGVRFLRLQFTDIIGTSKNVEVPRARRPADEG